MNAPRLEKQERLLKLHEWIVSKQNCGDTLLGGHALTALAELCAILRTVHGFTGGDDITIPFHSVDALKSLNTRHGNERPTLEALRDEVIAAAKSTLNDIEKHSWYRSDNSFNYPDPFIYALARFHAHSPTLAPQELVTDEMVRAAQDSFLQHSQVLPSRDAIHRALTAALAVGGDTRDAVLDLIASRRAYFATKDLHNGWSGSESGPCCSQCAMPVQTEGIAVVLRNMVGCKNPFQIEGVCQCHLPVREAVRIGIVEAHDQLIRALKSKPAPTPPERSAEQKWVNREEIKGEIGNEFGAYNTTPQVEPSEEEPTRWLQRGLTLDVAIKATGEFNQARSEYNVGDLAAMLAALKSIWPTPRPVTSTQSEMLEDAEQIIDEIGSSVRAGLLNKMLRVKAYLSVPHGEPRTLTEVEVEEIAGVYEDKLYGRHPWGAVTPASRGNRVVAMRAALKKAGLVK